MAVFSLSGVRTSIELCSIIRPEGLTLRASAKSVVQRGAGAGCPSPGTLFRRTRLWRVFRFLEYGLPSNCVRLFGQRLTCGPALKRCSTRRRRRLSESDRPIQKNPPMAGFSLSGVRTLHRTAFDYSARRLLTCGPALKRCSTRRRRRLSESRPIQNNPPMAGFSLSRVRTLHRTAFDYSPEGSPCGPALKRCSTRCLETSRMPYIEQSSCISRKSLEWNNRHRYRPR